MENEVKLYQDSEGETYLAHSLDQLLQWMADDLGVEPRQIDPPEDWIETTDWEDQHRMISNDWGDPAEPLAKVILDHINSGGPVPAQIATTYV